MARLEQNREIDLSTGTSFTIDTRELTETYYIFGTATAPTSIGIVPLAPLTEGMTMRFKFDDTADMAGHALTLLGEVIRYTDGTKWTAVAERHNGSWRVQVMPSFEENDIITTDHITDAAVTGAKLSAAIDFGSKDMTNVDIDSGTIDGTPIGTTDPSTGSFTSITTSGGGTLTTPAIVGGTIDNAVIGGVTPGAIAATTLTASGGITADLTGDVTGKADEADALATARTIAGQSFDGSANITIAPENLDGVTATAADVELLAGASGSVSAADILAITDINNSLSADANKVSISTGKYLEMTGYLKQGIKTVTGTDSSDADDAHVFAELTAAGTITLPNPATLTGKSVTINNPSSYLATISSVAGNFIDSTIVGVSTMKLRNAESITVVSDGTNWQVVSRPDIPYGVLDYTVGKEKVKIIKMNELQPKLIAATSQAIKMDTGDIITQVRFFTGTASGVAANIDIGADATLTGAAADPNGFIRAADPDVIGVYSTSDETNTYSGDLIKDGYFECMGEGYITVATSVDQSASATLTGSLIVHYI